MNPLDFVCLGDSIVYGYGVSERDAWPMIASKRLGLQMLNKGVNGDTSAGMRARFACDVLWNRPKAVFIMGGANDILMGTPLSNTCGNIDAMVEKALETEILPVLGIPIQVDGEMLKTCWYSCFSIEQTMSLFEKYREWLIAYCERKQVAYIDFQKKFPEYLDRAKVTWRYQDGVHPTRAGYAALADIFCDCYEETHGFCGKAEGDE